MDSCQLRGNTDCAPNDISNPTFNPSCCTEGSPCGLGEGGCTKNEACMHNLVCGKNNCNKDDGGMTNCCTTPWDRPG